MPDRHPQGPDSLSLATAVGQRIRQLREDRGVSLSALAAATGLGKGTLSELERGRRNPTLDTLFAITTTLQLPLSALLAEEVSPQIHDAGIGAHLLGRWLEGADTIEVYRMIVSHGQRESQAHSAGVIETLTVVNGRVAVGQSTDVVEIGAGQSHTFRADERHVYRGLAPVSTTVLIMRYPDNPA